MDDETKIKLARIEIENKKTKQTIGLALNYVFCNSNQSADVVLIISSLRHNIYC